MLGFLQPSKAILRLGETMPRYVIERNLPPGLTEADIDDDAPW